MNPIVELMIICYKLYSMVNCFKGRIINTIIKHASVVFIII